MWLFLLRFATYSSLFSRIILGQGHRSGTLLNLFPSFFSLFENVLSPFRAVLRVFILALVH